MHFSMFIMAECFWLIFKQLCRKIPGVLAEKKLNESVVCTCSQPAFGLYLKRVKPTVKGSDSSLFPALVRLHVLCPIWGSLQHKKDIGLWVHSSMRLTKVVRGLKHRMVKERLRELGLVSMEKKGCGNYYCCLQQCTCVERTEPLFSEAQKAQ